MATIEGSTRKMAKRNYYQFILGINCVLMSFYLTAASKNSIKQPADDYVYLYSIGVASSQNASIEDAKGVLVSRLLSTVSSDITLKMQSNNGSADSQMMSNSHSQSITLPLANVELVEQAQINNYWHSLIRVKRKAIILSIEDIQTTEQKQLRAVLNDNKGNNGTSCFFSVKEFKPNFDRLSDVNSLAKNLSLPIDSELVTAWQKLESRCLRQNSLFIKSKGTRYSELEDAIKNELTDYQFVGTPSQSIGSLSYQAKVTKTKDSSGFLNFIHLIVAVSDENQKQYVKFDLNTQGYSFFSEEDATVNAINELVSKLKNKME
tara:strand:- start:36 stop:995 length:960 start_codon:yes stop_codon:yes gene_type:complete